MDAVTAEQPSKVTEIELYWRPGCTFCTILRRALRRTGLPVREVNIWADPAAAARVRAAAGGNETVPTVFVGPHAMVNPDVTQVLAAAREHAPELVSEARPSSPARNPLLVAVVFAVLWVLLAASEPATTYHLAPLLVAASAPIARRWLDRTPPDRETALRLAAASLGITLLTAAVLALLDKLSGPDVLGGDLVLAQTVLSALLGAALGWWVARRGS